MRSDGPKKVEHGYVEGGTLASVEFDFKNVTRERFGDGIPVEMSIRAYRSHKGNIEKTLQGSLTVRNPDTGAESNPIDFPVNEYVVDEILLPLVSDGIDGDGKIARVAGFEEWFTDEDREKAGLDENGDPIEDFEGDPVMLAPLVTEDGRVQLVLRCLDGQQYLGVTQSGVYLRAAEGSFGDESRQSVFFHLAANDDGDCFRGDVQYVSQWSGCDDCDHASVFC